MEIPKTVLEFRIMVATIKAQAKALDAQYFELKQTKCFDCHGVNSTMIPRLPTADEDHSIQYFTVCPSCNGTGLAIGERDY